MKECKIRTGMRVSDTRVSTPPFDIMRDMYDGHLPDVPAELFRKYAQEFAELGYYIVKGYDSRSVAGARFAAAAIYLAFVLGMIAEAEGEGHD